jgi:DNA mismatch repair protein MutS2
MMSWRCCPTAGAASKLPKNVTFKPAPELAPVHQEINVIGQRAEEARDNVDQFLDRAVMATASRVRIVHGHGMGILRKVLWELLESIPTWRSIIRRRRRKAGPEPPSSN